MYIVFHIIKTVNKGVSECNYTCEFIVLIKSCQPYREQISRGEPNPRRQKHPLVPPDINPAIADTVSPNIYNSDIPAKLKPTSFILSTTGTSKASAATCQGEHIHVHLQHPMNTCYKQVKRWNFCNKKTSSLSAIFPLNQHLCASVYS